MTAGEKSPMGDPGKPRVAVFTLGGTIAMKAAPGGGAAPALSASDLLAGVPDRFDAVLGNLPYVAEGQRATLAPEITRHEPPGALFAGADGLERIRALLAQLEARQRVRFLALEVGAGQAGAVAELSRRAGFRAVRAECDLARIERVVVGER